MSYYVNKNEKVMKINKICKAVGTIWIIWLVRVLRFLRQYIIGWMLGSATSRLSGLVELLSDRVINI